MPEQIYKIQDTFIRAKIDTNKYIFIAVAHD